MYTSHSSRLLLAGTPTPPPGTRATGLAETLLRALAGAGDSGDARLEEVAARELRAVRKTEESLPKGIVAGASFWRCRSGGGAEELVAMRGSGVV